MLMLPVIVWSPLEQYSSVVNRECPKCIIEGQNSQLTATSWTDGSSTEQPRLLYCVNSNVSRIYSCPNKHRVLGHTPGIMEQIPTQLVPFHLWHVAGLQSVSLITFINYASLDYPYNKSRPYGFLIVSICFTV